MTTREPEWTDQDQAEIFALSAYRAGLCPVHGGPIEDCQESEADGGPAFEPHSSVCRAEFELVSARRSEAGEQKAKEYGSALMWGLRTIKGRGRRA